MLLVPHEYRSEFAKALETRLEAEGLQVCTMQTLTDMRMQVERQLNLLVIFLLAMSVLLAVVGGLGLMGTMSINVLERTREVGVMLVLGSAACILPGRNASRMSVGDALAYE